MVHALEEAWRVMVPWGIMVDVRPLSIDIPLEVVYDGGSESAGMIDMSPGIHYDQDADGAIDAVTSTQLFRELNVEYFGYTYYWKSIRGMKDDLKENWQDEVNVSEQVWKMARRLFNMKRPKTQIRVMAKMKLGIYEKIS